MGVQETFIVAGGIAVVICVAIDRLRGGVAICRGIAVPSAIALVLALWQRSRGVGIGQSWEGFLNLKFLLWMILMCVPPITLEALNLERKHQIKYLVLFLVVILAVFYLTGFRFFP